MELIDLRTEDGSRHFTSLPKTRTWHALRDHLLRLPGTQIVNFVAEEVTRAWIDFTFGKHRFSVMHRDDKFCFYVSDPLCPDLRLYQVAYHCEEFLCGA